MCLRSVRVVGLFRLACSTVIRTQSHSQSIPMRRIKIRHRCIRMTNSSSSIVSSTSFVTRSSRPCHHHQRHRLAVIPIIRNSSNSDKCQYTMSISINMLITIIIRNSLGIIIMYKYIPVNLINISHADMSRSTRVPSSMSPITLTSSGVCANAFGLANHIIQSFTRQNETKRKPHCFVS